MIRDGQAKRFDTGAGEDEKANSVDVGGTSHQGTDD